MALCVLVALLAFVTYGGSVVVASMQNGMASLEARLGADVIVVPKTATSHVKLDELLLEGVPGSFYMDASYLDKIASREGVEAVSPQYYLATVKAGCCSLPLQIIGFDPETDFTIQPWIARTYRSQLGRDDVVVGANVNRPVGSDVMFYGVECKVVSQLDVTGTSLDSAVFATNETLQDLIVGSREQGISVLSDHNPDEVISTIQVKVQNGYDVSAVESDINIHVRGVKAEQTRNVTASVSDSVANLSGIIGLLMGAIWVLAVIILIIAFVVANKQRAREFAVLRVIGASRGMLAGLVVKEAVVIGLVGAVAGIACALVATNAFSGALEAAVGVPYLMPDIGAMAGIGIASLVITALVGPLTSAVSAIRMSRVDVGQTLRGE